jgi:ubiquitin-protein ligase
MSGTRTRRLLKEIAAQQANPDDRFTIHVDPDRLDKMIVFLKGPEDSHYEGLVFELKLSFPPTYPQKPPAVKMVSPIFHCNISTSGNICLDILDTEWSPVIQIRTLLLSISSLLSDPNPDSPYNVDAAKLWRVDRDEHRRRVLQLTSHTFLPKSCFESQSKLAGFKHSRPSSPSP